MATRRGFLAGLAALTLPVPGWADVGNPRFLAAGKQDDRFVLHGLSATGETTFSIDLPGRGHAACAHPVRPLAVAFARRPGIFAIALDCLTGAVIARLVPPEGRQFNGHGVFSADGMFLFTSEVVAETSEGRVGLGGKLSFEPRWSKGHSWPGNIQTAFWTTPITKLETGKPHAIPDDRKASVVSRSLKLGRAPLRKPG